MKRALSVAVILGCAAATAGGAMAQGSSTRTPRLQLWPWAGPASQGSAPALPVVAGATQLRLRATDITVTTVDNPPSGFGQGDEIAVSGRLETPAGQPAGDLQAHEILTEQRPEGGKLLLTFTTELAAGQITASAILRITARGSRPFYAAILGGTGRYLGARGEIVLIPAGNGDTELRYVLLH